MNPIYYILVVATLVHQCLVFAVDINCKSSKENRKLTYKITGNEIPQAVRIVVHRGHIFNHDLVPHNAITQIHFNLKQGQSMNTGPRGFGFQNVFSGSNGVFTGGAFNTVRGDYVTNTVYPPNRGNAPSTVFGMDAENQQWAREAQEQGRIARENGLRIAAESRQMAREAQEQGRRAREYGLRIAAESRQMAREAQEQGRIARENGLRLAAQSQQWARETREQAMRNNYGNNYYYSTGQDDEPYYEGDDYYSSDEEEDESEDQPGYFSGTNFNGATIMGGSFTSVNGEATASNVHIVDRNGNTIDPNSFIPRSHRRRHNN